MRSVHMTNLTGANLVAGMLVGVDLTNVTVGVTSFDNIDLHEMQRLDTPTSPIPSTNRTGHP